MDSILEAASAALGRTLAEPVDLGGSARTAVVRCRCADGGSVVVKAYLDPVDGPARFVAEASGLAFGRGVGARLLAVDREVPLIVLADLGTRPSLADVLLGDSATDARAALLAWARGCGRLAARSIGREPELAAIRARFGTATSHVNSHTGGHTDGPSGAASGDKAWAAEASISDAASGDEAWVTEAWVSEASISDAWVSDAWIGEALAEVPAAIAALGAVVPDGLANDLAEVGVVADRSRFAVFSPGDICPDNNVLTAAGLRLLDFEFAGFRPVFLDAAYARMPFSSCWCVFRLPDGLADEVAAAYRAEVVTGYPELADDAVWQPMVLRAMALWTLHLTTVVATRAAEADQPMRRTRQPVPSMRQLLRYRWAELADQLAAAGELPALTATVRGLLAVTERWRVAELDFYPAFRTVSTR